MSLLVQRSDVSEFRRRFRWIALGMLLVFIALIGRLFYLQILEADENQAIARENIVRRVTLATTRGIIRDRNGKVLAASRPSYNVYVVPRRLDMETTWPKLIEYLGVGIEERARLEAYITAIRADDGPRKNQQILLKEDISRDVVATLATHDAELPGVDVVPVPVRYYPYAEVGSHVIGYMAEVDAERLAALRSVGYIEGDRIGVTGIERAWESYLRGTRGWEKVLVDARGRRRGGQERIVEEPRRVDPIPGRDLRLTLDADIQKAIDKAMRGELAGGVAVIDVRTGRILGLYSKPGYDPNALSGGSGKQVIRDAFRRLYSDPLKPALDKTLSGAYPPGSTFKPFTALAALEKGLIDARQSTRCRGALTFGKRTFRCTHVHGAVALQKAIAESCNVYFYKLAAEYGVGMDVIADMGQRYGLGARTGLGINAEAAGRMPTKAWMTLRNKGQYRLGFGLNAAIGQGATTVTVLQLALAYAALANGGTLYQPQIVRAVETSAGTVVQEFTPRVRRQIDIRPENLTLVHRAMVAGVNEAGGTAFKARLAGVEMAGKTGTAQVSHRLTRGVEAERVWYFNREHAWFAGYAPTRSPEVAVVVLVEHGGAGGKHAAPVAFEVVRAYQELEKERRAGSNERSRAGIKGAGRASTTTGRTP
ncbi:penicillin-binding protein 2 [Sorangium cellulosum]|uniref:Penicillin-binding protein 2 n=1 Tax=Sorangium cellulosum TaxID=56 RepID=A0A4P2PYJ0_SORCE|nr:penicillin-binding protein 2 [Sorangium cellulosum]AUX21646.1 penicillin-binding protein 2 [Sorangium cellulosum]